MFSATRPPIDPRIDFPSGLAIVICIKVEPRPLTRPRVIDTTIRHELREILKSWAHVGFYAAAVRQRHARRVAAEACDRAAFTIRQRPEA